MARKKARLKNVPKYSMEVFLPDFCNYFPKGHYWRYLHVMTWHLTLMRLNIPHTYLQHLLSQLCWSSWVFVNSFPCNYNAFDDLVAIWVQGKCPTCLPAHLTCAPLWPRSPATTVTFRNLNWCDKRPVSVSFIMKLQVIKSIEKHLLFPLVFFYLVQDTIAGAPAPERKKKSKIRKEHLLQRIY